MRNSKPCKACQSPLRTNKPHVTYCQRCSDSNPQHKIANMAITFQQKKEIIRLRAAGLSHVRIGQEMDICASTPYRYLTLLKELHKETITLWEKIKQPSSQT